MSGRQVGYNFGKLGSVLTTESDELELKALGIGSTVATVDSDGSSCLTSGLFGYKVLGIDSVAEDMKVGDKSSGVLST